MRPRAFSLWWIGVAVMLLLCAAPGVHAQLNQDCTVSVLNRNVRVNPDGSWVLPNVPANFGQQARARATCVQNGVTTSGESAFFLVPVNGVVNLPEIVLGAATQIPVSLTITPARVSFTAAGQTRQLAVTATYPDRSVKDVTAAMTGTSYTTSNPALVTVSADGLITAVASGTVVIQATHDGAGGLMTAAVVLSGSDTDGDGIPDDVEIALGLNPNDPTDAQKDFDRDGLTNLQEYLLGTNMRVADTDGDGLSDADEVTRGTNSLLADTDGDGIRDGLEVQTGSDPLDPTSFNLAQALTSMEVQPSAFLLLVNTIIGEASRQLKVTGHLRDGTTIDLTSTAKRTNYTSSNTAICSLGSLDGRVVAGTAGTCTITVTNSGFAVQATGTVQTFTPTPLSFVSIPGFANNVDVRGDFAHVAAGSAGLQVVDVTDRRAPTVVGSRALPGNANDVKVVGNTAFVAAGLAGLQILDVSDPRHPVLVGAIATPGEAWDVAVQGNLTFMAAGAGGLQVIDISNLAAPRLIGIVSTPAVAKGVDVAPNRPLVAVATAGSGLQVIDVTDPTHPAIIGSVSTGGDARDVVLSGDFAFVAAHSQSLTAVDLRDPRRPVVRASTPGSTGGALQDVAVAGRFAFGAAIDFGNGVPIIDVSTPEAPLPRAILNFGTFRADHGTGIAVDSRYVYLTASQTVLENGVTGDTRLYIGQYQAEDTAGVPPTIQITSPATGTQVIAGSTVTVTVSASDDVAVASVSFFVNGQVICTDTTVPYQCSFTVPTNIPTLTIDATAIDLGANTGTAPTVTLTVIPDSLTTVIGNVMDANAAPIAGATLTTVGGLSGSSTADGSFAMPGVPTTQGDITVNATVVFPGGSTLAGRSFAVAPVRGGVTNVGTITLRSIPTVASVSPRFALSGTTLATFTVMGTSLAGAAFTFTPSGFITVGTPTINGAGTQATFSVTIAANALGPFTLVATNQVGSSDTAPSGANSLTILIADADNDNDGYPNELELLFGSNPLDSVSVPDFTTQGELLSAAVIVHNSAFPLSGQPVQQELLSAAVTVLNNVASLSSQLMPQAFRPSARRSRHGMLHAPSPTSGSTASTPGATVDEAGKSTGFKDSERSITLRVDSDKQADTLVEGQTVVIHAQVDAEVTGGVEFLVEDVPFYIGRTAQYDLVFTVPSGLKSLRFAVRPVGSENTSESLTFQVIRDPLTAVRGRVVDDEGSPVPDVAVQLLVDGLQAEFFDVATPLQTPPDLEGRTADRTRTLTAVNLRNPQRILGRDPYGVALSSDSVLRIRGFLRVEHSGSHTFFIGSNAGVQLHLGSEIVIDMPNERGQFQEGSGEVDLEVGLVPIAIEFYEGAGPVDIQLSFAPPHAERRVITPDLLVSSAEVAITDKAGNFSFSDVPTAIATIQTAVEAMWEGRLVHATSARIPTSSTEIDAGDIIIEQQH